MPTINLVTEIHAPPERYFDLARSIDLHQISTAGTNEKAFDGRTSGLIEIDEFVTWEAVHLGFKQQLSSRITAYNRPHFFVDEQISGAFKTIYHKHTFEQAGEKVMMVDVFIFESPLGWIGKLFNKIYLSGYTEKLLAHRNDVIKHYAESDQRKLVLNP